MYRYLILVGLVPPSPLVTLNIALNVFRHIIVSLYESDELFCGSYMVRFKRNENKGYKRYRVPKPEHYIS